MAGLARSVAQVPRQFGAAYLATHTLSTPQAKAWRGIVACRTRRWVVSDWTATIAATATGDTTPAATGIARAVARGPRMPGCKADWLKCCQCPIRIWCSRWHRA